MKDSSAQIRTITAFSNALSDLRNRGCSDSTISELKFLIYKAFQYSETVTNVPYFKNNVRQTIEKQLTPLLEYRSMVRKRESYWSRTLDNFMTDLSGTITQLEDL